MSSSETWEDYPTDTPTGFRIRSKEDLNRVLIQLRKREETLKALQAKLKARETRMSEAQRKMKKRNDFLDAWEVSLKNKEAEMIEDRDELETLKTSLRKIGEDILALSVKTEYAFEGLPYQDDVLEEIGHSEEPEKKSKFGLLKSFSRKSKGGSSKQKSVFGALRSGPSRKQRSYERKTLRETLKEKRDKLKTENLEDEFIDLGIDEGLKCPMCGAEVTITDDTCPGCGADLNWGT